MASAIPVATLTLLALLLTANGLAQTMVGYGALTGAGATAPGAAGKATAVRLSQVGSKLGQSAAPAPRAGAPAGGPSSPSEVVEAASIVLRAEWGSREAAAEPVPASAMPTQAASTTATTTPRAAPQPRPQFLRRGASIDDLIGELGKPALVIQNLSDVGYDRKYVFTAGASRRYSVLVLGALVVDWTEQQ